MTSRYRCDALTNWAMKPLTLGAGHLWVVMSPWRMGVKWCMKCFIYWTADLKSSKPWSSQFWIAFPFPQSQTVDLTWSAYLCIELCLTRPLPWSTVTSFGLCKVKFRFHHHLLSVFFIFRKWLQFADYNLENVGRLVDWIFSLDYHILFKQF